MKPPFALPITPARSWEGIWEPDAEDMPGYLAQRYVRLVDHLGRAVVTGHDLFEFEPGHAEYIVHAVNCHGKLVAALQEARDALADQKPDEVDRDLLAHLNATLAEELK